MIVYLEPNVIAAIALMDDRWEEVVRSNADYQAIAYSDFGFGEVVSAIAIRARTLGTRAGDDGTTIASLALVQVGPLISRWIRYTIEPSDIAEATDLVARVTLGLRLPDAIHIAVARRIGATLVTNDRQQFRAAQTLGVPALNPLEQIPK